MPRVRPARRPSSNHGPSSPAVSGSPPATLPPDEPSAADRRWDRALFGGFLALVFLSGCTELVDGDFWWHLAAGERIVRTGEIPAVNTYTYTNPATRWIDLHWGFQVPLYLLWCLTGPAGIVLAKAAFGTAIFAVAWIAAGDRLPTVVRVALWLPPLLAFAGRYIERPELPSLLAWTVFLLLLADRPRGLAWLPWVQIAWVNVQGLFVLGPLTFGLRLLAAGLESFTPGMRDRSDRSGMSSPSVVRNPLAPNDKSSTGDMRNPSAEDGVRFPWRAALGWFAVTCLVCLANPYGIEGVFFPLVLQERMRGPEREFFLQLAGEFSGMGEFLAAVGPWELLRNLSTSTMLGVFVLGIAALGAAFRSGGRPWFELLLFGFVSYLGWQANRNAPLFAVVGGWAVVRCWGMALPATGLPGGARRLRPWIAGLTAVLALATVGGLLAAARGAGEGSVFPRRFGFGYAEWMPFDAVEALKRPGMPRRIYAAHLGMASLCLFELGPERPVFADPRLEANSKEVLAAYLEFPRLLAAGDRNAARVLIETGAAATSPDRSLPALLLDPRTLAGSHDFRRALAFSPHWRCVYFDPQALIFVPTDVAAAAGMPTFDLDP